MEMQAPVQDNGNSVRNRPIGYNPLNPEIEQFVQHVNAGVDSWEKAGSILVHLHDQDKNVFSKIIATHSFITRDMLDVFYNIGQGTLYPMVMLLPRSIIHHVRKMRYDAQKRVMSDPVQLVTRFSGDKPVIVRKPVAQLTAKEAEYALWKKGNRSVDWQIKHLGDKPKPNGFVSSGGMPAIRKPVAMAKFKVKRGPNGIWMFEPTTETPYNVQAVILENGQAVIELCEWGKE